MPRQRDRALRRGDCLSRLADAGIRIHREKPGEFVQHRRPVGLQFESSFIVSDGITRTPLDDERVSYVVLGVSVVRIDLQGTPQKRQRFGTTIQAYQDTAKVVERLSVGG